MTAGYTSCPQDERGLLDLPAWLSEHRPGLKVYCCGPAPLLDAVEAICADWPRGALRTERFVPRHQEGPARNVSFEVVLLRSGKTVTVAPSVSVLQSVQAAGVSVLSSCRHGVCGTCETVVVDGLPDHRDSILDDFERSAGDRMFICVSRSSTDRLVLEL
jgi:ferredoxin